VAFNLALPPVLTRDLWKVKIRDRERNEPPHVSVICGTRVWRFGLRERAWLDRQPPARDVPALLVAFLIAELPQLCTAWDALYPENPVVGEGAE
jgi:hypothetical protein